MNHWKALRTAVRNTIRSVVLTGLSADMQGRRCEMTRLGRPLPTSQLNGAAVFYGVCRGAVRQLSQPNNEGRSLATMVRVVLSLRTADIPVDRYGNKAGTDPEDILETAEQAVIDALDGKNAIMAAANLLYDPTGVIKPWQEPLRFLNDSGEMQDVGDDWFYADKDPDQYKGLVLVLDFGEARTNETRTG